MQRLVILGAVVLTMCAGCIAPRAPAPVTELQALELPASDLDFALALAAYSAGIAEELAQGPASPSAVDLFLEAAQKDPSNYLLARKASVGLLYRGRAIEASEVLATASSLNPTNYSLLLDLAIVADMADQPDQRRTAFRKALALQPANPAAYLAFAQSLLGSGEIDEALKILKLGAAKADRELMSSMALVNAVALLKGGFPDKSEPWFEFTALNSKAKSAHARLILSELYEGRGQGDEALQQLELAASAQETMPEVFAHLAIAASRTDPKAAFHVLDKGEQRFPMDTLILTAILYVAEINSSMTDAVDLLSRIKARAKETPTEDFYVQLGGAHERAGNIAASAEVFKEGLSHYPKSHEIMSYLAYMWADRDTELAECKRLAELAVQHEPGNGAYLDTLGWVYFKLGQNAEARLWIEKALKAMPDDPTIVEHLGDILAKDGDSKLAVENWKKSLELQPGNESIIKKLKEHGVSDDTKKE